VNSHPKHEIQFYRWNQYLTRSSLKNANHQSHLSKTSKYSFNIPIRQVLQLNPADIISLTYHNYLLLSLLWILLCTEKHHFKTTREIHYTHSSWPPHNSIRCGISGTWHCTPRHTLLHVHGIIRLDILTQYAAESAKQLIQSNCS
jgi:hypothetical protein